MKTSFEGLSIDLDSDRALSVQLAEQLTWLIASGQIHKGEKLPPVRGLADHLGISFHTVRAAYQKLEAKSLIATRQGSGSVAAEFDPVALAQSSSDLPTHTVGLVLPNLINPFYTALVQGAEEVARSSHMLLILCSTFEDATKAKEYLDMLVAKRVDGLIVASYALHQEGLGQRVDVLARALPVPIVTIDRPSEAGYMVLLDSEGAAYAATKHLIQHGHREIAIITCGLELPSLDQCYQGYTRAMQEHALPQDPRLVSEVEDFTFESGYKAAKRLLDEPRAPSAIFAGGDLLAIGAMRAIRDRGMRIPADVAIIGYTDIEIATYAEPPLTTVSAPAYQLGATGMEMLRRLIDGEQVETPRVTLPTKLVIRRSCGCTDVDEKEE
jgi:DNA-binding LacI/PurR family transcriptional regulator